MNGEQKPGGLEAIISDEEIARVHGHANFGPTMTPRDVVNEGVRKYAVGYTSGYTQLTILLEHGLITKPRPGSYEASLTKKGKRYARALGMYQATPAEPAEARVRELEARNAEVSMLAYRWMEAHDRLKAGESYELPSPADLPAAEAKLAKMERLKVSVWEFLSDWRKGDFSLCKLAELDAQSMESALAALQEAGEVG